MKKKKYLIAAVAAAMVVTGCSGSGTTQETTAAASQTTASTETTVPAETTEDSDIDEETTAQNGETSENEETTIAEGHESAAGLLTGVDAWYVVNDMGIGFNIGNSFDATGDSNASTHETAWGNPVVTQEFVDAIAAAGFKTVRLPVTWYSFIDSENDYKIDDAYLARVKEVIDYCYNDGLYVILNVHHDDWIENENLVTDEAEVAEELASVWTQLATYFAEYDQHLIFEAMNEPRLAGTDIEWTGNAESYETINYLDQIFADAVRSVDTGYNAERCLSIPQYAASNSSAVLATVNIPTYNGKALNNVIISVHSYAPYNFCLNSQATFDPDNADDTSAMDQMFETIKEQFLSQGIPVYIGETSATGKEDVNERVEWATYMSTEAAEYGVPIVIWDNGNPGVGNECHHYIDRDTCEVTEPEIIKALLDARQNADWASAVEEVDEADSLIGGNVIKSFPDGIENAGTWDYTFIAFGSDASYYADGSSIALVYEGEGSVKMVVDSTELSQWWIPVDPSSVEESGDFNIAYFNADDILKAAEEFGVENASQISNVHFLVADGTVMAYEVCQIAEGANIVYHANGEIYYMGNDVPDDPEIEGYTFAGWYYTKTYDEGTEFDIDEAEGVVNVYAKLELEK